MFEFFIIEVQHRIPEFVNLVIAGIFCERLSRHLHSRSRRAHRRTAGQMRTPAHTLHKTYANGVSFTFFDGVFPERHRHRGGNGGPRA